MGKLFRMADAAKVHMIYIGGSEGDEDVDWIRVRDSLTKREADAFLATVPTAERDVAGNFNFLDRFFELVVVDWSLAEENDMGEMVPVAPTLENYLLLDAMPAGMIRQELQKHLSKLIGSEVEAAEGESEG